MNYLRELNAFDTWLNTNPMQAESIALWFALMRIANSAGWPEEFTVANGTLQNKAGLSDGQLKRHRGKLVGLGLIRYVKSRNVNQAGTYRLLPISQNEPQNSHQNELQSNRRNEPQNEPQDASGTARNTRPPSENHVGIRKRNPLRFEPPS